MATAQTPDPTLQQPLRLWPGVVAVALQWLIRFGVPILVPGAVAETRLRPIRLMSPPRSPVWRRC